MTNHVRAHYLHQSFCVDPCSEYHSHHFLPFVVTFAASFQLKHTDSLALSMSVLFCAKFLFECPQSQQPNNFEPTHVLHPMMNLLMYLPTTRGCYPIFKQFSVIWVLNLYNAF
eukprot:668816_1